MVRALILAVFVFGSVGSFAAELKAGDAAPDFTLTGSDGKAYKLSSFKGQTVVLEWFNKDCPYVHKFYDTKTMQGLQKDAVAKNAAWQEAVKQKKPYEGDKGAVWLTIASSAEGKEGYLDAASAAKLRSEKDMGNTALLLDGKSTVARMYSAKTTPHMFVIAANGKIAYEGAIDDRPSADKKSLQGAQNYVSLALTAVSKSEAVKTASTNPYGCGVKY